MPGSSPGMTEGLPRTHRDRPAVSRVPIGVNPSFAYPPGSAHGAADTALEGKLQAADPDIAKAVRRMKPPRPGRSRA